MTDYDPIQIHVIRTLHKLKYVSGTRKPKYVPLERLLTPRISKTELKKALKDLHKAGIVGFYKQGKTCYLIKWSMDKWEHVL